jgi:hypothetical protein
VSTGRIVPKQYSVGTKHLDQRRDDAVTHGLEPRRQDLNHEPAVVAIDNERRNRISLTVDQALGGGLDARSARHTGAYLLDPPRVVHRAVGALQKPQANL